MNLNELKPLYFFSDRLLYSRSFARTLRIEYKFGKKLGLAWYCTQKEWDKALAARKAKSTQAGVPLGGRK